MNIFKLAIAAAIFPLAVNAASVDLNTWQSPEGGGNWSVQGGGSTVYQSINTPTPTTFFNGENSQGKSLSGQITVASNTSDDDFIGFVLGYDAGDLTNNSADYLLIDWKRGDQTVGGWGFGAAGLAISRVTGAINETEAWSHTGDVSELQRATNLGSTGWVRGQTYTFDLTFTAGLVEVFVNGIKELSVNGSFSDGSFGFYNFSQDRVTYAGIEEDIVPSAVPVPAAGFLLAGALGGLGLVRRRKKA